MIEIMRAVVPNTASKFEVRAPIGSLKFNLVGIVFFPHRLALAQKANQRARDRCRGQWRGRQPLNADELSLD